MSIKSLISSIMVLLLITLLNFGCTKKQASQQEQSSDISFSVSANQETASENPLEDNRPENYEPKPTKELSSFSEGKLMESLDELWNKKDKNLYVFLKQDKGEIKRIDSKIKTLPDLNEVFPSANEGSYTTYYIQKNDTGKIVLVYASPLSQSGDWYSANTYYFDDSEKLRAISIVDNNFNEPSPLLDKSSCAQRTLLVFFDENGRLVHEEILSNVKDLQGKKEAYLKYKDILYMSVSELIKKEKISDIIKAIEKLTK